MGVGGALAELFVTLKLKDEMSAPLEDAGKKTTGTGQKLKDLAPAAMAAGAALTGIGVVATGLIDNNRAMDASFKTTALSMGVSETSVKDLARGLQSVDSPIEEVAATLDVLARAGMTNVDSMGKTASAFDTLADATGQNADTLTDQMVPAFKALGIPLEEAPGQVDGLATMFRKSNVDIGEFSKIMTKVGPDLGEMGVGLEDVEAIMMSFADRGIQGREATSRFAEAVAASGGSTDGLYKALGMTAEEVAKYSGELKNSEGAAARFAEAQNSSFGVMDQLGFELEKVKQSLGDTLKPFEGVATAALAVGPAMAGVSSAAGLLGSETAKNLIPGLGKASEALSGGGGLMGALKGAGAGLLTFATGPIGIAILAIAAIGAGILLLDSKFHFIEPTLKWFGEIFAGIGDFLGKTFGPILDGVIGYIGELFGVMDTGKGPIEDILGAFKGLGEWIGKTGAAIGEVLGPAIQAAATWIGQTFGPAIKALFGILKEIAGFLVGRLISNIQQTWGVLQAIGGWLLQTFGPAVEKGLGILVDIWPGIQAAIGTAWTTIKSTIGAAWEWIAGLFSGKSGGGFDIVGIIGGIWTAIKDAVAGAWDLIGKALGLALDGLIWLIKSYISVYTGAMGLIWTAIKDAVSGAWELVSGAVSTALGAVLAVIAGVKQSFVDAVGAIWTAIKDAVSGAWSTIKESVSTAVDGVKAAIGATQSAFVSTVGAIWTAIKDAVSGAWETVKSAVGTALQAVITHIGTFLEGFVSAVGAIWTAINSAVAGAWSTIKESVSTAVDGVKAAIAGTQSAFVSTVGAIWTAINSAVAGAWSTIKGSVSTAVDAVKAAIGATQSAFVSTVGAIWTAINAGVSGAWATIKSSVSSALNNVKGAIDSAKSGFVSAANSIWSAISGTVSSGFSAINSAVSGAMAKVTGTFTGALNGLKSAWSSFISWLGGQTVTPPTTSTPPTTPPSGSGDTYVPPTSPGMSAAEYALRATGPQPNPKSYADNREDQLRYGRDLDAWKEEYQKQLAIAKSKGYKHGGGIYDAPGGRSEGLAWLQTGERVLSRAQTAEYDGGLLAELRELKDLIKSGALGGRGDVQYFPNAVIREEVDFDRLMARVRAAEANDHLRRGGTRGRPI